MKKYVAPKIDVVNLRVEERMAGSQVCNGGCPEDVVYNGTTYYALAGAVK